MSDPIADRGCDRTPLGARTSRGTRYSVKGGVFSEPTHLFFRNLPGSPHTSSHMSGHHLATVRRAGRKRGARFESSEALAEQPAVARSAVELHRCCARVSRAAALVQQHIDGVARASSAGTKSGSIAHSLVLLTVLAPLSRSARLRDQLGLDLHNPLARRRSELGNRGRLRHGQLRSPCCSGRRFANFQHQRATAGPRIWFCRPPL